MRTSCPAVWVFLGFLFVALPRVSHADTLVHRETGEKIEGTVTTIKLGRMTRVVLEDGSAVYVDLKRYEVVRDFAGAGSSEAPTRDGGVRGDLVYYYYVGDEFTLVPFLAVKHVEALGECLALARRREAVVIVEIDTYGGSVDPALRMAMSLSEATDVKTIAFIGSGKGAAYSAGALLALGCQHIYMKEDAVIGAAAPVEPEKNGRHANASEKSVSGVAAKFRALAESRGRPAAAAEAMVDPDLELYEVEGEDGERQWITVQPGGEPPRGEARLLVGRGKLLTLTAKEAVRLGLAEGTVSSLEELIQKAGLARRVRQERRDGSVRELYDRYVNARKALDDLTKKYNTVQANANRLVGHMRTLTHGSTTRRRAERQLQACTHQLIDLLTKSIAVMEKHNAVFLGEFDDTIRRDRELLFQHRSSPYGK